MEGTVGPRLFESVGRGVHGLSGSGERAGSQRFDVLGMANLGTRVDHFLVGFEKLMSELSELKDFSFNKWIAESSYGAVDEVLIRLAVLEKSLPERGERQLRAIAGSRSQADSEDRMSSSHGKKSPGVRVVQHKSYILGLAAIVVGVTYGC